MEREYSVKLLQTLAALDNKELTERNIFAAQACTLDFANEGDIIILLENGVAKQQELQRALNNKLINSAQLLGEGGLAVALALACVAGDVGAVIHMIENKPGEVLLFEKSPDKIILTTEENNVAELIRYLTVSGISFTRLGTVGANELEINLYRQGCYSGQPSSVIKVPVAELRKKWQGEKK
ncbi:AIR synthase-related protein [Desulfofalx alkaliphila]|uniref:AIR synthase-related protein n=1 Tax=Desulfofalx alkaliphila TaxID=105483 RepID=UPI0004E1F9B7|nr:AIR synthase-related protein [Desulfofalx alkaliphila]